MPSPRAEPCSRNRAARWLLASTLLAVAPKCLACLWAYAGLGAALGLGGRELCGAPATALEFPLSALPLAAAAIGAGGFILLRRRTRPRRTPSAPTATTA